MTPSTTHLVLVPTFNTGPRLLQTVEQALAVWRPVWVVVDGSTDGSADALGGCDVRVLGIEVTDDASVTAAATRVQAEDGRLDIADLAAKLKAYPDRDLTIGSFSAASNVTGLLTDADAVEKYRHDWSRDPSAGTPVAVVRAEDAARGRYIPLQVRLTLAMVAVTAVALGIGISAVLGAQYRAMERMTLSSGSSIAAFVASNAALPSVENAAAPPEERDWTPIDAVISAAAKDQSVRWMTMVDADGMVRGASDPKMLGTRYRTPSREAVVHRTPDVTVTDVKQDDGRPGFRFVHPIVYAGKRFGLIEVSIDKGDLQAAAATSRDWMLAFGAVVLLVVATLSFMMAKLLERPMRRLKAALRDAAMGDLDFRISHNRHDEFGELFDGFNMLAMSMGERLAAAERPSGVPRAVDATQIASPTLPGTKAASAPARTSAHTPAATAAGTPFDAAWRQAG